MVSEGEGKPKGINSVADKDKTNQACHGTKKTGTAIADGENDDPGTAMTGITGFQFPEWFITQGLEESKSGPSVRTRLLVHRKALTKGKYIDRDKKKKSVVPVRFVRACRAGHIADIDWYSFAHNGPSECAKQGRQLFIDERGTSGDLTEVWIRCECGKAERSMAQAAILANGALGLCDGSRPDDGGGRWKAPGW